MSDVITGAFTLGGVALSGAVAWVVARTNTGSAAQLERQRWQRERLEGSLMALLSTAETARQAAVSARFGRPSDLDENDALALLVSTRPPPS